MSTRQYLYLSEIKHEKKRLPIRRIAKEWGSKFRLSQILRFRKQQKKELLLSLPLELIFEILEHCDISSFANLLSKCRMLYSLWGTGAAVGCFLTVLKKGMTLQAWVLYRVIRAKRWEAVRLEKLHAFETSHPDRDVFNEDLPPTFQIDFKRVLRPDGLSWPNDRTPLNESPRTVYYGYGYLNARENRYTLMEDIFYLRKFAEYWVDRYQRDADRLPVHHPCLINTLVLKRPERIYDAFYSHWISELISIQEEDLSTPREKFDFHLLPHARSWIQAVKECQRQWRIKDHILHRFEKEMDYLAERDVERITLSCCCDCRKRNCECSRRRVLTKRRFSPFIDIDSGGHYHDDKKYWRVYSRKFPDDPEVMGTVEDLTLREVDGEAIKSIRRLKKWKRYSYGH
ncbi:hypothetical protein TWF970_006943 [Orbilia oligospora]|uniref:F-box domain-containing protein n=1 Tax=Orbilia oligospora TaxID=2813651 RepID=A0A7C8VAY7_ORBOL|nr:hypothetical protein TWF970_006943 [Orbilia oligospora]